MIRPVVLSKPQVSVGLRVATRAAIAIQTPPNKSTGDSKDMTIKKPVAAVPNPKNQMPKSFSCNTNVSDVC